MLKDSNVIYLLFWKFNFFFSTYSTDGDNNRYCVNVIIIIIIIGVINILLGRIAVLCT